MQYAKHFGTKTIWVGLLAFITIAIAGSAFFYKSARVNNGDRSERAVALILKQDISDLKLKNVDVNTSSVVGLLAELRGDKEFAKGNYDATRLAYVEAIYNFKKALEESGNFNGATTENGTKSTVRESFDENRNGGEAEITERTKALHAQILKKEPTRTPREQSQKQKKNSLSGVETETSKNDIHQGIASTSRLEAQEKINKADSTKVKFQEPIKLVLFPDSTEIKSQKPTKLEYIYSSKSDFEKTKEPKLKSAKPVLKPQHESIRNSRRYEETAEVQLQNLLNRYKDSLNNSDLQGLKTLLNKHFKEEDEKAWSKFFKEVKDIKATVVGEDYRINNNNAEVVVAVSIDFSNYKGVKQNSLLFSELWALENQDGNWVVMSRKF